MEARQAYALNVSLLTALIIFLRRLFVLERFQCSRSLVTAAALFAQLQAGVLFWVSLQSVQGNVGMQIASGVAATCLSWAAMTLLVRGSFSLPSRQQFVSLGFYVLTELSILGQVQLVLGER